LKRNADYSCKPPFDQFALGSDTDDEALDQKTEQASKHI
jgi:hypothetical protein